jgi:hypothetical protein
MNHFLFCVVTVFITMELSFSVASASELVDGKFHCTLLQDPAEGPYEFFLTRNTTNSLPTLTLDRVEAGREYYYLTVLRNLGLPFGINHVESGIFQDRNNIEVAYDFFQFSNPADDNDLKIRIYLYAKVNAPISMVIQIHYPVVSRPGSVRVIYTTCTLI